jgi:NAD(P)-dependent dehydrogenase (short-subunit alcohol dehydrogenase family)
MAREYRCRFLLLGRSAINGEEPEWAANCSDPTLLKKRLIESLMAQGQKPVPVKVEKELNALLARREIVETIQAIAEAGGQAEYASVDISDAAVLAQALKEAETRLGQITGILHGAGNLADKLIEHKTPQDYETVFSPKVEGLKNLLECLPPGALKHLVLFSSVAGFYGNSGQADYALANEILNKIAHLVQSKYPSCKVLSLNWGPWDGGMVTPALKEFFAKRRIEVIPVATGAQMLVDELNSPGNSPVQVVIGSPLYPEAKPLETELKTQRLRRKLSLKANPFLVDHVIGGKPVLPAICVINWVANACEQLYPGYTFCISENNRVLKGVIFDSTLPEEFTLELKEISKDPSGEIVFEGIIFSYNENNRVQYHYGSRATLRSQPPETLYFKDFNLTPDNPQDGETLYQNKTLFHGPSFKGVKRLLNISPEKVTLECLVPPVSEQQQGQFPVRTFNPYAVDVQLQCMLIWARHFYNSASLPLKIQKVEQFQPLPFGTTYYATMQVQSSSSTGLVATVAAHDHEGRVYTRVTGAEVTISERLNRLFEDTGSVSSNLTSV